MTITAKWNLRGVRVKFKRWSRTVTGAQRDAVKAYSAEAARQMVRCTPPAGFKRTVAGGIRDLKKRIKEDLMGDGGKTYGDEDIVWRRDRRGQLVARFVGENGRMAGYPGPFRMVRGKVSQKKLDALGHGSYGVKYAAHVRSFMKANSGQYSFKRRGTDRAVRLSWHGTRHIASYNDVKREVQRRQKKAGQLMAGWKSFAHMAGICLQPAVESQRGKGSSKMRRSVVHGAVMTGTNKGNYHGLQRLVDRQMPYLNRKLKTLARKHTKKTAKKLR